MFIHTYFTTNYGNFDTFSVYNRKEDFQSVHVVPNDDIEVETNYHNDPTEEIDSVLLSRQSAEDIPTVVNMTYHEVKPSCPSIAVQVPPSSGPVVKFPVSTIQGVETSFPSTTVRNPSTNGTRIKIINQPAPNCRFRYIPVKFLI